MTAVRKLLKRIRPVESLYVALKATPTLRDGLTYSGFRLLVWLVDRLRFWRPLWVAASGLLRRLLVTFTFNRPDAPPARLTLPVTSQSLSTLVEVFEYASYRPLGPLVPRTVLDVGANIGLASVFLHGLYPRASFVCVEPDPSNLGALRRNLAQNHVPHVVVAAALGRAPGWMELRAHRAASEYSSTCDTTGLPESEFRSVRVPVTTLAAVREEAGASRDVLLKIDVEGAEFEILGDEEVVLDGIDYLTGEFHAFAGDVTGLVDRVCRTTGLALLRRDDRSGVATVHFGRAGGPD